MSEDINDKFYKPLADDHLVMINKDTFTGERLKQLVDKRLHERLNTPNNNVTVSQTLGQPISIIHQEMQIGFGEMSWIFPNSGIKCLILKIGDQTWKPGKLRIKSFVKIEGCYSTIRSSIEFCPDDILDFQETCEETRQEQP